MASAAPAAVINGNVVSVAVNGLTIGMSLQRHHYRYCGAGTAAALNSLIYASVGDDDVLADVNEVGRQIQALLAKKGRKPASLFGEKLTTMSKRVYLVDNSGLDPKGWPNHFFVTSGTSVWGGMSDAAAYSASAIRRVEESIAARKGRGDKLDYRDAKTLFQLQKSAGISNPVIAAYVAAHTALGQVPDADAQLTAVSGEPEIVARARSQY